MDANDTCKLYENLMRKLAALLKVGLPEFEDQKKDSNKGERSNFAANRPNIHCDCEVFPAALWCVGQEAS